MKHLVVLTGAGISAESGLSTFTDIDGLWSKVNAEDLASIQGYRKDRAKVLAFYNERRKIFLTIESVHTGTDSVCTWIKAAPSTSMT